MNEHGESFDDVIVFPNLSQAESHRCLKMEISSSVEQNFLKEAKKLRIREST